MTGKLLGEIAWLIVKQGLCYLFVGHQHEWKFAGKRTYMRGKTVVKVELVQDSCCIYCGRYDRRTFLLYEKEWHLL